MFRFKLALLAWLAAPCFAISQTDGDQLFNPSFLHEIRFESPDSAFFTHLDEVWLQGFFSGDYQYLPCKVTIDGNVLDSVGLRIKGGISAFDFKRPLKIDFNEFVPGQDYDGMRKLNLHNGSIDSSMQREALSYEILRQVGVKAPRTAFAQVWINDELHGVYTMTEQVDKEFLRNYFADDEGTLYKNKTCEVEVASGDETLEYYEELQSLAQITDDAIFVDTLEKVLATEECLRFFLVEVFINAVDNPLNAGCNYYMYHEPKSGLLYWIPWDFNYAMYIGSDFPLVPTYSTDAVLRRMMEVPVYRDRYLQMVCEFLDCVLTEENLHPIIDANADRLRDAAYNDPRYDFEPADFDSGQVFIKRLITSRIASFEEDLQSLSQACLPFDSPTGFQGLVINEFMASNDSTSNIADPAGGYSDWIELYNNTAQAVPLEHCFLSNDRDFLKHWRFPAGSSIGSGEYLVVWADRDVDEPGLHLDFKLDKDGGEIFLIFEDFTLLDSVAYGQQLTSQPSARVPNGTGDFVMQAATFGADNMPTSVTTDADSAAPAISVYPNPVYNLLNVTILDEKANGFKLKISSLTGQELLVEETASNLLQVSLAHLSAGIYLLTATTKNGQFVEKLVVK